MKAHLKRLAMPKTWDIKRKKTVFVMRPFPGGATQELVIPLQIFLRDMIKVAKTAKEVRFILNNMSVLVNGKRRKEVKFPIGLMDVIEIPKIKKQYRLLINRKGRLFAHEIPVKEASIKPCKIMNKTILKKGIIQLNFTDGNNIIVKKDIYKTDDVVFIDFTKKNITEHLKFEKKSTIFLIGGSRVGIIATLEDIKGNSVIIKSKEGTFETIKKYVFILGTDKPRIDLPE